jgi:hypothetical protein
MIIMHLTFFGLKISLNYLVIPMITDAGKYYQN